MTIEDQQWYMPRRDVQSNKILSFEQQVDLVERQMPAREMTEREMINALLGNDSAWTLIVELIGEEAVKVYLIERKREEGHDRAIKAKKNPPKLHKEKTWAEIAQELKPEIMGWKWSD